MPQRKTSATDLAPNQESITTKIDFDVKPYLETCRGCGILFEPNWFRNQTRCKPACGRTRGRRPSRSYEQSNAARTTRRLNHTLRFVGVDGEGQKIDKVHRYVLLSVGERSLAARRSWNGPPPSTPVQFVDAAYLTYEHIFPFLWDCYLSDPDAVYIGFYLSYDFIWWLKELPENRARLLLSKAGKESRKRTVHGLAPFPVHVGEWEIDLLGFKRFRLRKHVHRPSRKDPTICRCMAVAPGVTWPNPKENGWLYVCDSGAFWQSSFLSAINPANWPKNDQIVSQSEYNKIQEGKAGRGNTVLDNQMMEYNLLENEILSRITNRINEGLSTIGIKLDRDNFYGPGQAAQEWLNLIGAPTRKLTVETIPEFAREAGRMSYYGGWFEVFKHGHIPGSTWEYDINSAYPAIIADLPCLLHGEWSSGKLSRMPKIGKNYRPTIRFVHATVDGFQGSKIGSMLHRNPLGIICRPLRTKGWYVQTELDAAIRAKLITEVKYHDIVDYIGCDCPAPIAEIRNLYRQRLVVGKNTAQGKGLKLVYNSAYGKFAQSVGEPKYSNAVYASLITSGCRTKIIDAIGTHPNGIEDLVMVATDAVYFRSAHNSLPLSDTELGLWSVKERSNLSVFMPGIYWDDDTRKGKTIHSRGVAESDLRTAIDRIDEMWKTGIPPIYTLPIRFAMTSAVQAIAWNNWSAAGEVFENKTRDLDATPKNKRNPDSLRWEDDVLVSYPYAVRDFLLQGGIESMEYDSYFGERHEARELNPDVIDHFVMPDGTVIEMLGDLFRDLRND